MRYSPSSHGSHIYISLAELTAVGPVEHPESHILAAEADPARLEVPSEPVRTLPVTLQLPAGLLDADVTELKEAQPHPTAVHTVYTRLGTVGTGGFYLAAH